MLQQIILAFFVSVMIGVALLVYYTKPFKKRGILYIISGPSGSGKTTLTRELIKENPDLNLSVSYTTRPKRDTEINGNEYFFISEEIFKIMIENNQFLEWAVVYGNYYGTPRDPVENLLEEGKNVLLEIDVQGAKKVRSKVVDTVTIFILPPSHYELKKRLSGRETESKESVEIRMNSSQKEMKEGENYDFIIVNDSLDETKNKLLSLVS